MRKYVTVPPLINPRYSLAYGGGEGTVTRRLTFPPFRFFFGRVGGGGTATLRLVTPWIILPLQHNLFRHSLMLLYLKDLNVCSDKAEFSFLLKKTAF